MFSSFQLSVTEGRFASLFAVIGILFLGIYVPEGILLPKAQIIKLAKIFETIGYIEKQKGQSLLMKKTIEYIDYVAQSMTDLTDKFESISHYQSIDFE